MSTSSPSEVRYARSGDVSIAYQTLGDGPIDVVMAPGFPSHLESAWQQPRIAHRYRRLSSSCRLILPDKRGAGLSDRVPADDLLSLDERIEDLAAVLDAVSSERASMTGCSDGVPPAAQAA